MNNITLVKNYAIVLFESTVDKQIHRDTLRQLTVINDAVVNDGVLKNALFSPTINKSCKIKLIELLVSRFKIQDIARRFLLLLIHNARMHIIAKVLEEYKKLFYKDSNIQLVKVTVSSELKKSEQRYLYKYLKQILQKEIKLLFEHNSDVIAGIIIRYDNYIIDASVAGVFRKIRTMIN